MKKMMKIELERAFKSWGLWLAVLIGLAVSMEHVIRVVIPSAISPLRGFEPDNATVMPLGAFQIWIGHGSEFENALLVRLFPILSSMPYAVTYLSDIRSGMIKNFHTRTKKINYLMAKYIAVFVTGGIPIALPLLINYLISAATLPSLYWQTGVYAMGANSMWTDIFFTYPHIYVLMYISLLYVCGGLMSTLVLVFSTLVSNRFVAVLAPYIVAEFANAVLRMSGIKWVKGLMPSRLFNIAQTPPNFGISYVVYIGIMLLLGILVYFIGGLKHETY